MHSATHVYIVQASAKYDCPNILAVFLTKEMAESWILKNFTPDEHGNYPGGYDTVSVIEQPLFVND